VNGRAAIEALGLKLEQTLAPGQTVPFNVPSDVTGASIPLGVPLGGRPTELLKNTNVIARLDADKSGKAIRQVG
jgi:hypothetical protein